MLLRRDTAVVEGNLKLSTGNKTLVVIEIVLVRVLCSAVGPPLAKGVGLGRCRSFQLHGSGEDRIHRLRLGPLPLVVKLMPPAPAPAPPTAVEVPPGPPPELSDVELAS